MILEKKYKSDSADDTFGSDKLKCLDKYITRFKIFLLWAPSHILIK